MASIYVPLQQMYKSFQQAKLRYEDHLSLPMLQFKIHSLQTQYNQMFKAYNIVFMLVVLMPLILLMVYQLTWYLSHKPGRRDYEFYQLVYFTEVGFLVLALLMRRTRNVELTQLLYPGYIVVNGFATVIVVILLQSDSANERYSLLLCEHIYYLRSLYVTKYALCLLVCCQNFIINVISCLCFLSFNVILIQQAVRADRDKMTPMARYQSNGADLTVQTVILSVASLVLCFMRDYFKKIEMVENFEARNKLEALNKFSMLFFDKLSEGVFIFKGGPQFSEMRSLYCN